MDCFVGVDCGSKGVMCFLTDTNIEYVKLENALDVVDALYDYLDTHEVKIMVENVHAIYQSSANSTFSFGYNVGWVHGIIETTGLKPDRVPPKVWQAYLGVKSKGKEIKQEVADLLTKIYPNQPFYTGRGKLIDGVSDSLGIAHYLKGKCNGSKNH